MTVHKGAFYFILALQLLVLGALLIGAAFLKDTREQAVNTAQLLEACERNNLMRDAVRWTTSTEVERALLEGDQATFREGTRKLAALTLAAQHSPQKDRPWLVDCTVAYRP